MGKHMPVLMEGWIAQIFNEAILQEKKWRKEIMSASQIFVYSNSDQWEN